jgi:hypothetical protein
MHKERTMSNQQPSASHLTELLKQLDESLKNHVAQTVQGHLTNIETEFDALKQEINRLNSELKNLKESAMNSAPRATTVGATATRTAQANHPSGLVDNKLQLIWSIANNPGGITDLTISNEGKKREFDQFVVAIDRFILEHTDKAKICCGIVLHIYTMLVNDSTQYSKANFDNIYKILDKNHPDAVNRFSGDFSEIHGVFSQLGNIPFCVAEQNSLCHLCRTHKEELAEKARIAKEEQKLRAQNANTKPGKR